MTSNYTSFFYILLLLWLRLTQAWPWLLWNVSEDSIPGNTLQDTIIIPGIQQCKQTWNIHIIIIIIYYYYILQLVYCGL